MIDSFESKYFPITTEVGFFEAEYDFVVNGFIEWQRKIIRGWDEQIIISSKNVQGTFPKTLNELLPLTTLDARRYLLIQTNSDWVAFFENGYPYPDIDSAVGYLSEKLKCRSLRVGWSPNQYDKNSGKGTLGATIFTLYGPEKIDADNCIRSIQSINEGSSWQFYQTGEPLSFEDVTLYKKRKKSERFNREVLDTYLKSLGLDFFNEEYYKTDKVTLVFKEGEMFEGVKCYSLQDARENLQFIL